MNTQNLSTLQVFQPLPHKCNSQFFQCCPKYFVRFLCGRIMNLLKGNLQSVKRHQMALFQNEIWLLSPKRIIKKQTRDVLASEKELQPIKVITHLVISHLSGYGAVFSRPCLCVKQQQDFENSGSYKTGTHKVLSWTETHEPNWFAGEGNKLKPVCQSKHFERHVFVWSSYQVLNSQTLILDGVETKVLHSDFAQQLCC